MRRLGSLLLFHLAFASAVHAQDAAEIRIEPPAPNSRTPLTATISGLWGDGCPPQAPSVSVTGGTVRISFSVSEHPCSIVLVQPVAWRHGVFIGNLEPGRYDVEAVIPQTSFGTIGRTTFFVRDAADALTAAPNVITSLPAVVRLRASGIGTCLPTVSPCRTPELTVTINGVVAPTVRIASHSEIVVEIPETANPPAAGEPFTIVVSTDDGRRIESKTSLFFAGGTSTYDPSLFERVLIPVILSQEGAYGSRWVTDAIIANAGDEDVTLFRTALAARSCPIPEGCPLFDTLPARVVGEVIGQWTTGLFVHVSRQSPVRFQVLARDLSRQSEALGTEIPVVRENDWRSGPIHLMNVPADPRFRVTLRVYLEGDVKAFSWVPIRIFRIGSETPLVDTTLSLDTSHNGQIPATAWVADVAPHYRIPPGEPLRIEIGVPGTGHRFWAFASVTNNTTQHVTVISPQ